MAKKEEIEQIVSLEMDLIDRPKKVARLEIDEQYIDELAESIKERGLMQAIRVSPKGKRYEIVYGDRRFLAHKKLGRDTIKAIIKKASEGEILLDRAIENIQQVDLTPLEEAQQYSLLVEKLGASYSKIAKITGKSAGAVKRTMDILKMPEFIQRELHRGRISKAAAEELQQCPDEDYKKYLVEMGAEHGVTQSVARQWVQEYKKAQRVPGSGTEGGDPPAFQNDSQPVYTACFLCKGPVDIMKALRVTVCIECGKQLQEILNK